MTPELFRRVAELYERARHQSPGERLRFVAAECGGDRELRAEVEALLAADREAGGFLSVPAKDVAAALLTGAPAARAEDPVEPGRLVGPYRVLEKIGAGGMGHVYLAQDTRLGRKAALKCLRTGIAERSRGLARLVEEARAASALNHPNILTIYDLVESEGQPFMAAEYIEGETLWARMARSRLSFAEIAEIGTQVAKALAAAHGAGIVHGDIKPGNIMIRGDGLVKVLDFGLASQSPGDGSPAVAGSQTAPAGTPQYMSPEQALRKAVDWRTDIFSLGVVLYEMTAGSRPFHGGTDAGFWYSLQNDTPRPLRTQRPDTPARLDRLVSRALAKEPTGRPDASEMVAELERLTRSAASRWKRRLTAAAAVAIATAGALLWFTRPVPAPRVTRIAQITSGSDSIFRIASDGTSIYYASGPELPGTKFYRVSAQGGDPVTMAQLGGKFPLDVARDGSELLLGEYNREANGPYPVWVVSNSGGPPRRVGTLIADYAQWSRGRDKILYSIGAQIRMARGDGSGARTVAVVNGRVMRPAWWSGERSIRFAMLAKNVTSFWDIDVDGTHLRPVFPDWKGGSNGAGVWTANGAYYVFTALGDLWAAGVPKLFRRSSLAPVRLTNGPLTATFPESSHSVNRILFIGGLNRGEMVRFERHPDRWMTYLGGLEATQMTYSRDGRSAVWVSYPDRTVWRSGADGSGRAQLTRPPMRAVKPQWSPDGSQIAFFGAPPGKPYRIYVVPSSGGAARQLTHGESGPGGDVDASWSPDGARLAFGSDSLDQGSSLQLHVLDVKTGQLAALPESQGLWSPAWSPDGRYIAALGFPVFNLWLYDVAHHTRMALTPKSVGWPCWSQNGRYLYFEDNTGPSWSRLDMQSRRVETLANLDGFKMATSTLGWVGVTPDGSIISTRDIGSTEIYALDWEAR